jgi:asparagine synthase (glutamine-hydrolysing)
MTQLICGILHLDGTAADEAVVRRMVAAMIAPGLRSRVRIASRGPAAIAAARLALRGDDAEPDEPALIAQDNGLLAADITIHDRARLPLATRGRDPSDGAFLQAALADRGTGALRDLHGDFAFAAWRDDRLTLARDHFGARPLVYTVCPGRYLAFASSPTALLRTGLASTTLDEEVAASWVLQPSPPPGRTIYRDIRPVDAAHVVEWRGGDFMTRRYWRLDTRQRLPFGSDPRELADETARLLTQAVERRLPAEGPGAGHLSGGLDSSPVAVLAARALSRGGRRFYGYTFREPEQGPGLPGAGDAPMADLVAAAEPGITAVRIISPSLLATFAEGVESETLLPLSHADPEEQVLRHAAAHGARVVLSGWGGDQIVSFHGRGAEAELLRAGRLIRLWRHLRVEAEATGLGRAALFRSAVVAQALPRRLRVALRRLTRRGDPFLDPMASRSRMAARHRRGSLLIEDHADYGSTHEIRRDKAEAWFIQTRLEAFARQGARHGVAYAFPMLDIDLAEFSIQVPGIFLRGRGWRRLLLREALEHILPDEVRLNPVKLLPFPGEGQRNAAAREHLLGLVRQWRENERIRDFLDLDFIAEMIRLAAAPAIPADLEVVDLTPAFQLAALLTALDGAPASEPGAGAARAGGSLASEAAQ